MKKIINGILLICFCFCINFCFIINTKAADYFSISASSKTVKVGETVKLTVYFDTYESGLSISSSNNNVLSGGVEEDWVDKSSYVTYFTAKSAGTATIYVNTKNGTTMDPNNEQDKNFNRSVTITVVAKNTSNNTVDINKNYSKNNYLSSLNIEGYELNPTFNKETLEYNVELEPGTEKINISAAVEDKKASVKGIGEINVTEGINTIEVIVTAENGNERTYKIIATVEEKDPIEVKINDKKYRVVKKKELIEQKDGYKDTTVIINNFEVPSLYNEVTDVTLVALKDEEGNIKLFSYDSKTGKYSEYKEFGSDIMNLYIHENKDSKYDKVNIKINDVEVIAYKLDNLDDYYLLYATNTTTGNEGYYLYDIKENSVQRYDTTMIDKLTKDKDRYLSIVLVLSCVCFLSMLFLLIEVNKYNKLKNEN